MDYSAIDDLSKTCLVDNLIELVKDLGEISATPEMLLCACRVGDKLFYVTSNQIMCSIKWWTKYIGPCRKGFLIN